MTTAVLERTALATQNITRAYAYACDPTPEQAHLLRSHIGGSRFCYNTLLGQVKDNWDQNRNRKEAGEDAAKEDYLGTSHFDLLYLWAKHRDEMAPWWGENGTSTHNDAAQRLSRASANWHAEEPLAGQAQPRRQLGQVRAPARLQDQMVRIGTCVRAGRFYASSRTCSQCGTVKAKLSLDERTYRCEACGLAIDRDVNAAINLARMGLAGTSSVTGRGG